MRILVALTLALAVTAAVGASPAGAAERAKPRIAVNVAARGFEKTMTVRLTDAKSGKPISGAKVSASATMTRPHVMTFPAWPLKARSPGVYQARVDFLMPADWEMIVKVSGENVIPTTAKHKAATTGAASGEIPLPAELGPAAGEDDGTARVWIIGVVAGMVAMIGVLVAAAFVFGRPGPRGDVPAEPRLAPVPEPPAADMSQARPRA